MLFMRKISLLLLAVLILLGAAWLLGTPKGWIEARIKAALAAQGFAQSELTLAHVSLTSATLQDVNLGGEPPLVLKNITLHYSPLDLLSKRLQSAEVSGLSLDIRKQGEAWQVAGLQQDRAGAKTPFALPVAPDTLNALPFANLALKDSRARIATAIWQLDLPLALSFEAKPAPQFDYAATGLALRSGGVNARTGDATLSAALKENRWEGDWEIKDIETTGAPQALPKLNAAGTVALRADKADIAGRVRDAAEAYAAEFVLTYDLASPAKSALLIKNGFIPWHGGKVAVQNARIPLGAKVPITLNLNISAVSADALMQQFTGKRASATGTISGTLPVTLAPDGTISFTNGKLYAGEPGTITVSPDVISGTNEQLALVRTVLQDFRYTSLSIGLDSGASGLELTMRLEGNNPRVQQGRPVKLNVNLKGDVLGFVQQNLLWLNDPRKLLERGIHANP